MSETQDNQETKDTDGHSSQEKNDAENNCKKVSRQVDASAIHKDPRRAAPKDDLKTEDRLELSNLTRRERKQILRQRFKNDMAEMNTKDKIRHFFTYNIWKLAVIAMIIFVVAIVTVTIYNNKRPIVLSYVIINSPDPYSLNTDAMEKSYMDYYGFTDKQQVVSTEPITMDLETFDENYNRNPNDAVYTSFPINCTNNYYDIFISDKKGVECCANKSRIYPLNEILSAELYDIISGNEYKDRILSVADYYGDIQEFAIDISDTAFAQTLNLGYDDVYICFPGYTEDNLLNVERVLNFIFHLELDLDAE